MRGVIFEKKEKRQPKETLDLRDLMIVFILDVYLIIKLPHVKYRLNFLYYQAFLYNINKALQNQVCTFLCIYEN